MYCQECKMGYASEVSSDVQAHRKYHDSILRGFPVRPAKSDTMIWTRDDLHITVVVHRDAPPVQRQRAQEIAWCSKHDMPYDQSGYDSLAPSDERDVHVFLLYKGHGTLRGIGLLIAERRGWVWPPQSWKDRNEGKEPERLVDHPPIWSICRLWIHGRYRHQGFARLLVDEAVCYLGMTPATIGWYTPFTPSAEAFVRSYAPKGFYVAK